MRTNHCFARNGRPSLRHRPPPLVRAVLPRSFSPPRWEPLVFFSIRKGGMGEGEEESVFKSRARSGYDKDFIIWRFMKVLRESSVECIWKFDRNSIFHDDWLCAPLRRNCRGYSFERVYIICYYGIMNDVELSKRNLRDESPWGSKWIGKRVILFHLCNYVLKFELGNFVVCNVSSWNSKGREQVYFFGPKCFRVFTLTLSLCSFLTRRTENSELRLGAFFEYERRTF